MPTVDRSARRREMIEALQALAADVGPDISVAKFCRRCGFSNSHIYYYFENWADLRQQAGLLLATLKTLSGEIGPDITLREFVHHTGISVQPIERIFGGWRAFKAAAGLTEQRNPGLPPQYTSESIRKAVEELLAEHKGNLTLDDFTEKTGISADVVQRYGGWSRLRRELGYSPRGRRPWLAAANPLQAVLQQLFPPEHFLPWLDEPDPFLEPGADSQLTD